MLCIELPDESFGVVWAEGSIFVIGFDRGLEEWRRLIRPGGFLVVHDLAWLRPDRPEELRAYWSEAYPPMRGIFQNLAAIPPSGYGVLRHFPLPEDAWWLEYYEPLEKRFPVAGRARRRPRTRRRCSTLHSARSTRCAGIPAGTAPSSS